MVAKRACYLAFTLTPCLFRLCLAYWISASLLASTGLLSCPLVEASAGTTAATSATPRGTAGTGSANAGRVQLNATGSGLRSGEFLPIVDGPGPLVCPQSLTTQQVRLPIHTYAVVLWDVDQTHSDSPNTVTCDC